MSSSAKCNDAFDAFSQTFKEFADFELELASSMVKFARSGSDAVISGMRRILPRVSSDSCCSRTSLGLPSMTGSCCDIPEPCWVPKCLGEFECSACAGAVATLRIHLENTDMQGRVVHAIATGSAAKLVTFSPQSLNLGPKERGTIEADITVPKEAKDNDQFETIIWIRGCRDYYARLTAVVGSNACCWRNDLNVCDGPDHVIHWYDHFYCARPCLNQDHR